MITRVSPGAAAESSDLWTGTSVGQRCIIITGASSGLGAALARAHAAPGSVLGLVGRNAARLQSVAKACRADGAQVITAVLDVGDAPAMRAWLIAFDTDRPVDLLIANAAISTGTRDDGGFEGFDAATEVIRTNLLGVVHCVEALLPRMLARGRGHIAVVGSIAAYRGMPDSPSYCASKAGVLAYGESLRGALEPRGLQVSVIVPGFFVSPMSTQYSGRKLFLLNETQAVTRIMAGLRRRSRRIVFPRRLAILMRLADLIPAWFGDRIMRGFSFRIAPRGD